jgi:polyphosphate kinase
MWDAIKMRDILIHTPYQSYDSVVSFVTNAALDDSVLSIKMTLYRTSGASPIIAALEKAALNGKQVTVFVEIKARFDEKQNIAWAERLEKAGVVVVHGIVNLKVHAKALLIIRREQAGIKRYVYLSTGNFNEQTAKLYSDFSLFTANTEIANDVILFFNIISGYSALQTMKHLCMAPVDLKDKIIAMIEREIACSTPENPGLIIAKMNSLAHEEIIASLYKAAASGVRIKLNVRGICRLVPGVTSVNSPAGAEGTSPPIEVISIIDRYLEHARVFYFWNGGAEELYLSSADWMPRNLERRIELMFPVLQKDNFERVKNILGEYFSDTQNAFRLNSDGTWEPVTRNRESSRAQETLQQLYKAQAKNGVLPSAAFEVRRKG